MPPMMELTMNLVGLELPPLMCTVAWRCELDACQQLVLALTAAAVGAQHSVVAAPHRRLPGSIDRPATHPVNCSQAGDAAAPSSSPAANYTFSLAAAVMEEIWFNAELSHVHLASDVQHSCFLVLQEATGNLNHSGNCFKHHMSLAAAEVEVTRFRAELDHAQQQLLAEAGSTAGVLLSAHTSLSEEMKTIGLSQTASTAVDAAAALLAAADALVMPDASLRAEPGDLGAAAEGSAEGSAGKEAGVPCMMLSGRQGSL